MKQDEDKHTLVEEGTEFEGILRAKCRVIVRGGVDGTLEAPAVEVADTGIVTGQVRADRVRSQGILAGTIDAQDVSIAGTVRSDTVIRAKTLEVNLAAEQGKLEVTFGDCIVEVGDMPAERTESDAEVEEPKEASGGKRNKKGRPESTVDAAEAKGAEAKGSDAKPDESSPSPSAEASAGEPALA